MPCPTRRKAAPILFLALLAAILFRPAAGPAAPAAPPAADYRTEGVTVSLNEQALKEAMAVYWSGVINRMPPFQRGEKVALAPDAFRILAKAPVQKGGNVYFAVKLGLDGAERYYLAPPFPLTMVVDPTGTLFFSKVIDIAEGGEAVLRRAPAVTRTLLPEGLASATVKAGTGTARVVLVSDPFCGYCRKGYAYISAHMDKVLSLKVVHHVLFADQGSEAAAWIMEYARGAGADLAAVYDFSYTDLRPAGEQAGTAEAAGEDILNQYKQRFPGLFAETHGDVKAMYRLLAERYASSTSADRDRLVRAQLPSTPVFVVNDELLNGFDERLLSERLSIPPAAAAPPAPDPEHCSGPSGLCTD